MRIIEPRVDFKASTPHHQRRQLLFLALSVAGGVRLYLMWQYYCISSDGLAYINAAKDFYAGNIMAGLSSGRPPGYPLLIAAFFSLIGDWELAGQILSITCGVLLIVPLCMLFKDVFDQRIALLACFLLALSPFLARYAANVRSESMFIFLSAIALLLFYQGIIKTLASRFFWGGLLAGFAYLVRPEGIGFLAIVPAVVAVQSLGKRKPGLFLWAGKSAGLLFLGFFILALPYIVYLSIDTGHWGAISRKAGETLAVGLNESGVLEETDQLVDPNELKSVEFIHFIRHHPFLYVKKIGRELLPAAGVFFEALYYSYVPFFLVGLFSTFREKFWERKDLLLLAFVLFYIFGFALIYVKRRYSLQVVPIALGWTAVGILWVWDYVTQSFSPRVAKAFLFILCSIFLAGTLPKTLTPISRDKAYVRDVGRYLKNHDGSNKLRVALFDDRIAFYAGVTPVQVVAVEESRLQEYLRDQKTDYLAAESKTWQKIFPTVAKQPKQYGLILEIEFVGSRNDRMLLFKVI